MPSFDIKLTFTDGAEPSSVEVEVSYKGRDIGDWGITDIYIIGRDGHYTNGLTDREAMNARIERNNLGDFVFAAVDRHHNDWSDEP